MKQVAKVMIWNEKSRVLLMTRNNHPTFGDDPDLPGGLIDPGETPYTAVIREVFEESAIKLNNAKVLLLAKDTLGSAHGTEYYIYETHLCNTPKVKLSWEHASYEWVSRDALIIAGKSAKDGYMHFAVQTLKHT